MAQSNWQERHSNNIPPLLLGAENYNDWKFRMKIFLQKDSYEWDAVENGIIIPMKDGKPTPVKELTTDEVNSLNYNARAMNSLLNGLSSTELRKVSACTSAKQVWDTIKVSHEGTSKVREVKLDLLLSDYESFRLEKDESIKEAQGRFLILMNSIALLERHIPQAEINRKILRSLPKKFAPKVTTLQDSTLISAMETLTLFSELEEFENQLRRYDEEDEIPRKKTLALRADDSDEDFDEDIALLTKKFQKFLAKKKSASRFTKFNSPKKDVKNSSKDDACFECGKKGHYKKDCFKLKAKQKASGFQDKRKNKAFLTWSDDESEAEIDSDDEVAQLCLAGIESNISDDEEVNTISNSSNYDIARNIAFLQGQNKKL
ncbi:CCHC-type domain-containing protein [Heracleum sosnowskyi]|uniref:CCHC-type domain-containing protein n=1 Tax=Heracleum sosnowskyi TaxID=360622 RepID=A0AAD8IJQ5_9APIA|nr:CCHC-type domain-containing protein [Heracleum sosnowskyi]